MERSVIRIASILPPRHASTFFQSFIPQERFCGLEHQNEREYIENVGYRFEYHFTYYAYSECSHRHKHIVSIREPLDAALSFYDHFVSKELYSLDTFLYKGGFPKFSDYVKGSIPEDYDVICNVGDIQESLRQLEEVLGLTTNCIPRNVNKNRVTFTFEEEKEFKEKFAYEYDIYYTFLEEFNRRKNVIL